MREGGRLSAIDGVCGRAKWQDRHFAGINLRPEMIGRVFFADADDVKGPDLSGLSASRKCNDSSETHVLRGRPRHPPAILRMRDVGRIGVSRASADNVKHERGEIDVEFVNQRRCTDSEGGPYLESWGKSTNAIRLRFETDI
jgi:hypothetical protein